MCWGAGAGVRNEARQAARSRALKTLSILASFCQKAMQLIIAQGISTRRDHR
jgi:hypothetical protein